MATTVSFDPFAPAVLADPYPYHARLRDESPVHRDERSGVWFLSRYADVLSALRDPERFSSRAIGGGGDVRFLIGSDPPDHTALRRLVSKPFAPRAIGELEPRIRSICEDLVEEMLDTGGDVDVVDGLAVPLPVTVIAEMLGIPSERREDFKRWSDALIGGLEPERLADRGNEMLELFEFFGEVAEQRRAEPGDDLVSLLVSGREPLSTREVVMFCMLLLVAGNETTTNLIGNAVLALADRPEVEARLRDDPGLLPQAVEEFLRFDSPVQLLWRLTTTDVELDGAVIPEGSRVAVLYGSANRDPRKWGPDADRLDIDRDARDHVAFGSGIHLCLGANLARLEARVAFETLFARTSGWHLAGEPQRTANVLVRGVRELPVELTPA